MKGWIVITFRGMRRLLLAAAIAASLAGAVRADFVTVNGLSDLVFWAGTGENEAGFVLQFSAIQSPTSVAWGYRWNGAATMKGMMDALAGTMTLISGTSVPPGLDARLSIAGRQYSWGVYLNEIAYDQTGLPAPWSQSEREIVDNYGVDGTYPALYFKDDAGGNFGSPTMSFVAAAVGISDLSLVPGGWYGFVQGNGASTFSFTQPVSAVPEPGGWVLTAGALAAAAAIRLRRRRLR